jgi:activator of HSP90 ATPase
MKDHFTRRDVSVLAGSIAALAGAAGDAFGAMTPGRPKPGKDGISHTSAAIHQEIAFSAPPERIYETLTIAEKFDRVVQLSAAMNSGMKKALGSAPTMIDAQPGGAFSLFGGYVTGRNLELILHARIVQAWRAGSWDPGEYSIARFALVRQGAGSLIVFDHKGFPDAAAAHLAEGWHINYWEPLAKALT